MKTVLTILVLASFHVHALGPIPNGKYRGSQACMSKDGHTLPTEELLLEFSDSSLRFGATLKEIEHEGHGFFKFRHFEVTYKSGHKTKTGQGDGYFTRHGVHLNATINMGGTPVTGEDTFFHRNRRLYLVSSAAGYKCEGRFDRIN